MPLRDHFRPPLQSRRHWEGMHGQWPAVIVAYLTERLPPRYFAEPRVHPGSSAEIDVATFEEQTDRTCGAANGVNGSVATAVWAPARPTLSVAADLAPDDEYEVRVYDESQDSRLVAAVEIVSPANKDRPGKRRAFVAKCAALLKQRVSVSIVDVVTTRHFNLYGDVLEMLGVADPAIDSEVPTVYAVACRGTKKDDAWQLEAWMHPLAVGQPMPTLPLWLADDLALPLELETTYEEACRMLRIA